MPEALGRGDYAPASAFSKSPPVDCRRAAELTSIGPSRTGTWRFGESPLPDNPIPQARVLPSHQFLGQLIAALVYVLGCSGKLMVDPGPGRIAEIIRDRQHFVGGFAMVHFILRE